MDVFFFIGFHRIFFGGKTVDVYCLCYFDMLLFCYMNMSYYAARGDAGDRRLAMQGGNFTGYGGAPPCSSAINC